MKWLPIFAIAAVGGFAALGFAAGTFVSGHQQISADLSTQDSAALVEPALPAAEAEADAIMRAAEARTEAVTPAKTAPVPKERNASDDAARPHLVKMANVTLPVRKSASVSFVVADLAVAVRDAESAAHYVIPQNAARLQAAIETAMARAADTPILRGVSIDSQQLSGKLTTALREDFTDVEDVLFLTLYKHDVGYN
jgi:hypothetical protein